METTTSTLQKLETFQSYILPAGAVLIVTHDYPDPDCLATAFGVQHILKKIWQVKTVEITFGGFVGRAENRAMIRYLNIPTVPIMLIDFADFDKIILVDAFPGDGNVSLQGNKHQVHAVFDHHPHKNTTNLPFYCDLRENLGATSTIITQYLMALGCTIPVNIATALFYGIKTDTNHLSRNVSPDDLECYKYLFDFVDHQILSKIVLPDRDPEYFRVLHRACESLVSYNTAIVHTHLGTVTTPDFIPEIADLFRSLENVEWVICTGIFKNQIFFSIRTRNNENAGRMAERLATLLEGSGGGHSTMSAGRIPLADSKGENSLEKFADTMKMVLGITDIASKKILS